jgi:ribosomal protein L11 methyltransferase
VVNGSTIDESAYDGKIPDESRDSRHALTKRRPLDTKHTHLSHPFSCLATRMASSRHRRGWVVQRRRGAAAAAAAIIVALLLPLVAVAFQASLSRECWTPYCHSRGVGGNFHRRWSLLTAPAAAAAAAEQRCDAGTFPLNAWCPRQASEPSQPLPSAAFRRILPTILTRRAFALRATRVPSPSSIAGNDAFESSVPTNLIEAEADDAASLNSSPSLLRSVTFCVPRAEEPDLLCELLMEVGAVATSLTDANAGTARETALFGEPIVGTVHGGAYHRHDVWNVCNVTALFPDSVNLRDVVDLVQSSFLSHDDDEDGDGHKLEVQVRTVDDRDWVVHVQQSWKPIVAGRFVLKFPWHDDAAVQKALRLASAEEQANDDEKQDNDDDDARLRNDKVDPIVLELQGGVAFGTGEHATTQLCLRWVEDVVSEHLAGHTTDVLQILDYGAGSGILGMAACALDRARVSSIGIDIDVDACRIANDNARQNRLNMRNYLPPSALLQTDPDDAESQSLLLKAHRQAQLFRRRDDEHDNRDGTTRSPDASSVILPDELDQRTFPIVVANILASPLTMLAPSLMRRVAPGGRLGLSGVLHHQAESVLHAYEREGLVNGRVQRQLGDWVLITGTRPNDSEETC